jgi:hypothetical protein
MSQKINKNMVVSTRFRVDDIHSQREDNKVSFYGLSTTALSGETFLATWTSGCPSTGNKETMPEGCYIYDSGGTGYTLDLYAQIFHKNTTKIGEQFKVNTMRYGDHQKVHTSTLPNGNFVTVWESICRYRDGCGIVGVEQSDLMNGIFGQIFNESGDKLYRNSEGVVTDFTIFDAKLFDAKLYAQNPIVKTSKLNDKFAVIWKTSIPYAEIVNNCSSKVEGQMFNLEGGKLLDSGDIEVFKTCNVEIIDLLALSNGEFLAIGQHDKNLIVQNISPYGRKTNSDSVLLNLSPYLDSSSYAVYRILRVLNIKVAEEDNIVISWIAQGTSSSPYMHKLTFDKCCAYSLLSNNTVPLPWMPNVSNHTVLEELLTGDYILEIAQSGVFSDHRYAKIIHSFTPSGEELGSYTSIYSGDTIHNLFNDTAVIFDDGRYLGKDGYMTYDGYSRASLTYDNPEGIYAQMLTINSTMNDAAILGIDNHLFGALLVTVGSGLIFADIV